MLMLLFIEVLDIILSFLYGELFFVMVSSVLDGCISFLFFIWYGKKIFKKMSFF